MLQPSVQLGILVVNSVLAFCGMTSLAVPQQIWLCLIALNALEGLFLVLARRPRPYSTKLTATTPFSKRGFLLLANLFAPPLACTL